MLPETTVGKHNPPCHLQMPTKALSCKKEAIYEHGPEAPLCPVGQGSFKMNCFKGEKCGQIVWFYGQTSPNLKFWLEITDAMASGLKKEGDLPACYQRSVKNPGFLIVCISAYGMGSLHVLERTMNNEMYIKVLEQWSQTKFLEGHSSAEFCSN